MVETFTSTNVLLNFVFFVKFNLLITLLMNLLILLKRYNNADFEISQIFPYAHAKVLRF